MAAGPFIGPKGGKWADARHTIPWKQPGAGAGAPHHFDDGAPSAHLHELGQVEDLPAHSVIAVHPNGEAAEHYTRHPDHGGWVPSDAAGNHLPNPNGYGLDDLDVFQAYGQGQTHLIRAGGAPKSTPVEAPGKAADSTPAAHAKAAADHRAAAAKNVPSNVAALHQKAADLHSRVTAQPSFRLAKEASDATKTANAAQAEHDAKDHAARMVVKAKELDAARDNGPKPERQHGGKPTTVDEMNGAKPGRVVTVFDPTNPDDFEHHVKGADGNWTASNKAGKPRKGAEPVPADAIHQHDEWGSTHMLPEGKPTGKPTGKPGGKPTGKSLPKAGNVAAAKDHQATDLGIESARKSVETAAFARKPIETAAFARLQALGANPTEAAAAMGRLTLDSKPGAILAGRLDDQLRKSIQPKPLAEKHAALAARLHGEMAQAHRDAIAAGQPVGVHVAALEAHATAEGLYGRTRGEAQRAAVEAGTEAWKATCAAAGAGALQKSMRRPERGGNFPVTAEGAVGPMAHLAVFLAGSQPVVVPEGPKVATSPMPDIGEAIERRGLRFNKQLGGQ